MCITAMTVIGLAMLAALLTTTSVAAHDCDPGPIVEQSEKFIEALPAFCVRVLIFLVCAVGVSGWCLTAALNRYKIIGRTND